LSDHACNVAERLGSGGRGGHARGPRPELVRSEHRRVDPSTDLRRGRPGGRRQRVRRAAGRARPRSRDGAVDLERPARRDQPRLQAGGCVRDPDRRPAGSPAGSVREGAAAVTQLLNAAFWTFVGIEAGIYTIFALGLQLQFGYTGLLNFGHAAFMAIAAYTMAILVVKGDLPLWAASLLAIGAAMLFGLLIGLPTLR